MPRPRRTCRSSPAYLLTPRSSSLSCRESPALRGRPLRPARSRHCGHCSRARHNHIDGSLPRRSRGWQTARECYQSLQSSQALIDRSAFVRDAHCAIEQAVQDCESWRERRLAEREAILQVLERYGLVIRTRGRPQPDGRKPDTVS